MAYMANAAASKVGVHDITNMMDGILNSIL